MDRTLNNNRDIYVSDLGLKGMTRLTFDARIDGFPAWSRDNLMIAFEARTNDFDIHARAANGANDGDLLALPLTGTDRTPIPIATTPAREGRGVLSPDGR